MVVPDFFYGDPYDPENTDKPLPIWRNNMCSEFVEFKLSFFNNIAIDLSLQSQRSPCHQGWI